jgi:hypothetical protein
MEGTLIGEALFALGWRAAVTRERAVVDNGN